MYAKEDESVRLRETRHDNKQSAEYGTEEYESQSIRERNTILDEKKEIKDIDLESEKNASKEIQKDGGESE